jgi:H+/Cl- antiporter ClcA
MSEHKSIKEWWHSWSEQLRIHLSRPDALLLLALLGLATGLLAGGVIVLFRVAVEGSQGGFLPGGLAENYEALHPLVRLALPVAGGLLLGLFFRWAAGGLYVLGVARVMERLAYHEGHMTLRGFILQFVGAAIAIISGHSVGREGPHIFLGAASGSLLGQRLSLPNNSIRTMVGCGVAAGIAASFNTPLAGVVFALEVVMMEYTLASFTPVILAAVSANALSIAILGSEPAFRVPAVELGSLFELPMLLLLGLVVGTLSAAFIHLLQLFTRYTRKLEFWWRTTLAGAVVGVCALLVPEVMGVGYDTVNSALLGELGLGVLLGIVLVKLLATAACIGMGVPGGLIGPTLFMGAVAGSLMGVLMNGGYQGGVSGVELYALLGMGAMMGATLQAPLAALVAMMELTRNPAVIMPGMLVITVAGLTASELFRKESIFISVLKASGMDYKTNPVMQALRRVGVGGVMEKNFRRVGKTVSLEQAETLLSQKPEWLLVEEEGTPALLMAAVDLARHIQDQDEEEGGVEEIDLLEIPAKRKHVGAVNLQATLQEALELMDKGGFKALYVERMTAPGIHRIYGVLTREQVESAYRY